MANQPYELNPSDSEKKAREKKASTNPPTIANLPAVSAPSAPLTRPTKSVHQCPNCGAWAPSGSSVCTECGTRLQQKPQKVRCRLCGATASASLVICPHCGRELQAAPSRVLSWGAPTVLVCLFLMIMIQRWESGNPFRWVQLQVTTGRSWVNQLATQLDPQITISILPEAVTESNTVGAPLAPPSDLQENAFVFNADSNPSAGQVAAFGQGDSATSANTVLVNTPPTETLTSNQSMGALTESVTVTPTVTLEQPTALPSPTPTMTATTPPATPPPPTPTAPTAPTTVAATPTNTPRQPTAAVVQTLQKADTPVGGIGGAVTAANASPSPLETPKVTILQATATLEPTPTPVPTQTATSIPATRTYTVRAGDTPLGIAIEFDISVNELLASNGMSVDDARRLRVGQVLIIPGGDVPATPTQPPPSPTTASTATPATATPTATTTGSTANTTTAAAASQSAIRVDGPALRSPEIGSSLSCGSSNSLIWLPVTFIRETDQYLLHLGFLSGYNGDGSEQVTWILEQWRPANVTLWDLDEGLCGLAPQAFGRQWRWYVEVVEAANGGWQSVSPPSQIWGFSWN